MEGDRYPFCVSWFAVGKLSVQRIPKSKIGVSREVPGCPVGGKIKKYRIHFGLEEFNL